MVCSTSIWRWKGSHITVHPAIRKRIRFMIIGYKKSNILIYFLGNQFYSIANVVMFAVVNDMMGIKQRLYQFYELVNDSGIKEFQKAIETFKNWQKEILSSFAFDLQNGYIEGINNQTKVIKRNAFGFRRIDRFRLRVLLHHQYKKMNMRVGYGGKNKQSFRR